MYSVTSPPPFGLSSVEVKTSAATQLVSTLIFSNFRHFMFVVVCGQALHVHPVIVKY